LAQTLQKYGVMYVPRKPTKKFDGFLRVQ